MISFIIDGGGRIGPDIDYIDTSGSIDIDWYQCDEINTWFVLLVSVSLLYALRRFY